MKDTRKCTAVKRKNQADSQMSTEKKPMSTSSSTKIDGRIDIRIPKNSKIYEFLYVDMSSTDGAAWKQLDRLLAIAMLNKDDFVLAVWEDFVRRISFFYPEKRMKLDQLRPLILRGIVKGEKLPEIFWEELRKEL